MWPILAQWFLRRFLNDPTPFLWLSSLEVDLALYFNNLKSPLPKDDLYQVWLKLACLFWRFLKIFCAFLLFCNYLPLGKGVPLHLHNLESPPPKDDLCQVWLKLAKWFWRKSKKCKSLQTDGQSEKLTWAFSSGELKMICLIVAPSDHYGPWF
jgi:hypothetical protein